MLPERLNFSFHVKLYIAPEFFGYHVHECVGDLRVKRFEHQETSVELRSSDTFVASSIS